MSSVFKGVLDTPLLKNFGKFCKEDITDEEKISAYAAFVGEIYESQLPLSLLVARLLFEDENVYIRARAEKSKIKDEVKAALRHELSVFSELAALTPEHFRSELGIAYVSPFGVKEINLPELYESHARNVRKRGYGIFSSHVMFRLSDEGEIEPVISADRTSLSDFVGYEAERERVIENTLAHLRGGPSLNTLLCGNAGTGKSSTVKAIANKFFSKGLRLIELRKDQLSRLPFVMGRISRNPLKFIIFIDDLSFTASDDNFSMLKAALEGSASAKADNAVIYATSNRRHIIKESFSDRTGDDVHRNDTLEETLSLSERFGLVVYFEKPTKKLYLDIVRELAKRAGVEIDGSELEIKAEAFALRRGSRSARCAEQFVDTLLLSKP